MPSVQQVLDRRAARAGARFDRFVCTHPGDRVSAEYNATRDAAFAAQDLADNYRRRPVCAECGLNRDDLHAEAEWRGIDVATAICCEVPL